MTKTFRNLRNKCLTSSVKLEEGMYCIYLLTETTTTNMLTETTAIDMSLFMIFFSHRTPTDFLLLYVPCDIVVLMAQYTKLCTRSPVRSWLSSRCRWNLTFKRSSRRSPSCSSATVRTSLSSTAATFTTQTYG